MSRHSVRKKPGSFLIAAIFSGLFTGTAITLALSSIGVERMETLVFATLSGLTLAAFVYRERSLTADLKRIEADHQLDVKRQTDRMDFFYDESLVCLAYFDAGTLSIDRVSPGLMKGLKIAPDTATRGKSMSDLLRVPASSLEALVCEAQSGAIPERPYELMAEDALGCQAPLMITANYQPHVHMIEASIFFVPTSEREEIEEMENAKKDLDRFRKGLYRRESRILELKTEVNEALKQAGAPTRYRTDKTSDDTNFRFPDVQRDKGTGGLSE